MAIIKKAGVPKLGMVTDPIDGTWPPPELEETQPPESPKESEESKKSK